MEKLPCINCITLAICRNIYRGDLSNPDLVIDSEEIKLRKVDAKDKLVDRCTLLNEFLYHDLKLRNGAFSHPGYLLKRQLFYDYMERDER